METFEFLSQLHNSLGNMVVYWKPGCAKQFDDHLLIFISTSTASHARLFLQEVAADE